MCDFHSICVRRDGAIAHIAKNSHSKAVEAAKWTENDSVHKQRRFAEVEWNGQGKYPGAEKISRFDKEEGLTNKQVAVIDRHYGNLSEALNGSASALKYFQDLGPEYRDVLIGYMRDYNDVLGKKPGFNRKVGWLAARICEGVDDSLAVTLSGKFITAFNEGRDLSLVWPQFAVWMLVDPKDGVIKFAKRDQTKKAIEGVADLYKKVIAGQKPSDTEWREARAKAAAYAAYAAAAAAYAAYAAAAAAYAAYAAYAAAAAYAAYAADAADARRKFFALAGEKLLQLINEAPLKKGKK